MPRGAFTGKSLFRGLILIGLFLEDILAETLLFSSKWSGKLESCYPDFSEGENNAVIHLRLQKCRSACVIKLCGK